MKNQTFDVHDFIAFIILMLFGFNAGVCGLFEFNAIEFICKQFSNSTTILRVVYTIVGLMTMWSISTILKMKLNNFYNNN